MCLKYTDALQIQKTQANIENTSKTTNMPQIQNSQANTEMFQEYKHLMPNAGETVSCTEEMELSYERSFYGKLKTYECMQSQI